ncbi:MAG: carbon-nitrogen hydrolase family protein [Gemmatimonadales bacterium]
MTGRGVLRVAAVQAAPALLDLEAGLALVEQRVERAAADGARVVAFPETFLPGYPAWLDFSPGAALWDHPGVRMVHARLVENAIEVPGPAAAALSRIAAAHRLTLVIGIHERAGRTLYNTLLTFGAEGTLLNHHRKLMPTYSERMVWGLGDGAGLRTADAEGWRVGGLICWEHWMPLARQVLHDAGEDIHVAAWPAVKQMNLVASRHYAFEGRCFVIAVGGLMRTDDLPEELPPTDPAGALLLRGGSAIIGPDGAVLAGPSHDEETILVADCDAGLIAQGALTLDVSGHYSRPDVFDFAVRDSPPRRGS